MEMISKLPDSAFPYGPPLTVGRISIATVRSPAHRTCGRASFASFLPVDAMHAS